MKNIKYIFNFLALTIVVSLFAISFGSVSGATGDQKNDKLNEKDFKLISEARQLTFDGPKSGEGYFSADGKKLIFQSERYPENPFYQMYLLDLESGNSQLLSTGQGKTTCGWIHPDLKKVMWSSTHLDKSFKQKVKAELEERAKPVKGRYAWSFDENFDIFESDLKGKNLRRLTTEMGYDAEGSYSPNGEFIVFASNRTAYDHKLSETEKKKLLQDPSYFMEIYIMKSDGSQVKRLTTSPGYDGGPFFSADGKKITWRRFSESGASAEIYTMNIDGSEQKQITHLNSMSWAPFYHSSGQYIIFATTVGGYSNFELFIVDAEGLKKPVRVTFAEGFDGLASFSPDGQQITWSHRNEKGESQIYLAQWNHKAALQALELSEKNDVKDLAFLDLSAEITSEDAKKIVTELASDKYKGRFTGSAEEQKYTEQISLLFKKWGLKPALGNDFVQTFEFTSNVKAGDKNAAQFMGRFQASLKYGQEFQLVSFSKTGEFNSAPLAFAGFGLNIPATPDYAGFDSYKDIDVKNKWVIVLDEFPRPATKDAKIQQQMLAYSRLQHKITVAKNKGAYGLIVVREGKLGELKFEGSLSDSAIPVLKISASALDQLLQKSSELKDVQSYSAVKSKYESYQIVPGFVFSSQYFKATIDLEAIKGVARNVIGVLQPELKTKALLIGAHADHLGTGQTHSSLAAGEDKNKIHYGADDNASGVAGVLELAHFYSTQKKIKRPLYFALWSGEEIGVLGSSHFVKTYPQFSKRFLAGLNMDMIGRLREQLYIQGVGSAQRFKNLAEKVAVTSKLQLAVSSDPYQPTDSMSIYLGDVPSISFFTGAHSEYHTPLDKPETLNYLGLTQVTNAVRTMTETLLQDPDSAWKKIQVEGDPTKKMEGRSFRIYLGTIPDYSQEGVVGVRISGTTAQSPADKAGLKKNDIIVEIDSQKIENIYDYVYSLQSMKPQVKINLKVLREGQKINLDIVPVLKE